MEQKISNINSNIQNIYNPNYWIITVKKCKKKQKQKYNAI